MTQAVSQDINQDLQTLFDTATEQHLATYKGRLINDFFTRQHIIIPFV